MSGRDAGHHIERRWTSAFSPLRLQVALCSPGSSTPAMRVDVDTCRESHPLYVTIATVRFKADTKH